MDWIEPLSMQTWLVNVFAGTPDIFIAIAIMVIVGLSAYFRMTGINMFFMMGVFLLMFSGIINSSLIIIMGMIGGLLIGYWISKLVK